MSKKPSRLVFAACTVFAILLVGCRSQPATGTQEIVTQEVASQEGRDEAAVTASVTTEEVTRVVTEVVTVEGPPVEVTRIVEEIVEVTAVPVQETLSTSIKALTICMVNEPASLYLYDGSSFGVPALAKNAVLYAIYENLYTTRSYDYQAQGLEKLPDLAAGDAEIIETEVRAGDVVADINNDIVVLEDGITIRDVEGNEILFEGTPVSMSQMVVRFTLRSMVWSDGMPVTAEDSRFSFEIAADPNTPGDKSAVQRTSSYIALDELSVEWTGVPGWLDPTYFTNIWTPLPAHQLGRYAIAELPNAPEAAEIPLSNGPFAITEWVTGDHISMVKNEHYYRAGDGLPHLDAVNYKFVQNTNQLMALLLAGQCDIGAQDGLDMSQAPLLLEAEASGLLSTAFQINDVFEHIDFGINPEDEYRTTRPDWFEDVRVRQAMIMCTNRQAMVSEALLGLSEVIHAYVPTGHPLYPEDLTEWPYDIEAANELLEQAGYVDRNGDGIRQDPVTRDPFHVELGIGVGGQMRQQIAQMFQANMLDCGIGVEITSQAAAEWFAPEGPLFGRRFDLAQFPWITTITPACDLYVTSEIPAEENDWLGNNETGWSNAAYDDACESALGSLVGTEAYRENHQEALRRFADQVPVIPLFSHLKLAAARPQVRNFNLDPTQDSELWNIFEIDLAP